MKFTKFLTAACLVALVLAACVPAVNGKVGGSIKLVGSFTGARSILPPISMDVAEYRVVGTGPTPFDTTVGLGGGQIDALLPGAYHLVAYAANVDHTALGETAADCTVNYGQTTTLSMAIVEYTSPDGAVHGQIGWEPSRVNDPQFAITLTDTAGTTTKDMPFALDLQACSGVGDVANVHPGWWIATGILQDGTQPSTGFASALRVAAGRTTSFDVFMHALQTSGSIGVTFSWSGNNELELTGSPAPGDIQLYETTTIPVTVSSGESFNAKWYINGVEAGTGPTYDLVAASFLQAESYRLDCVAIGTTGDHAASLTWNVVKSTFTPAMLRISGTVSVNPAQYPLGSGMTVSLWSSNGATQIGTHTTTNGGGYSFETVPAGQYGIKVRATPGGPSDWSWWNSGQGKVQGATPPELVTIPQNGTTVFDFLMGIGG